MKLRSLARLSFLSTAAAGALALSVAPQPAAEKRVAPVPSADVSSWEKGDKLALVIGVGDYPKQTRLAPLEFAAEDARAVAGALEEQGYLVRVLADSAALRYAVLSAIDEMGEALAGKNATAVVFFSGHGFEHEGRNYLATFDAFAENLGETGLRLDEVERRLRATGARRQVMLVDACRNEPGGGAKSAGLRSFGTLSAATGLRALFSTKAGGVSYESEDLGHGVFTHFLLSGLAGEAAGSDGLVTFHDLASYVAQEVRAWSYSRGQLQVPFDSTGTGEASGDFLLARAGASSPARVQATPSPGRRASGRAAGATRVRGADGMKEVWIPAGSFRMGSTDEEHGQAVEQAVSEGITRDEVERWYSDERVVRQVRLGAYWVDRYEVTNEQYKAFIDATGRRAPTNSVDAKYNVWTGKEHPASLRRHPVVNVSWHDAGAYCAWAGGRLPTEAEWEKAARGTDGRIYPWGNSWRGGLANHGRREEGKFYGDDADGYSATAPVGSYEAAGGGSPYGVEDMAGNVWEWVSDWYGTYSAAEVSDPKGPREGEYRVLRGGSWDFIPSFLRVANRYWFVPDYRNYDFGFRCARDSE